MDDIFNQSFRIQKDVLSQEVSGESVLLDLNSESYYSLNELGTRLWQLLKTGADLEKIYITLFEEYEVGADELRRDLEKMISEMLAAGLIILEA